MKKVVFMLIGLLILTGSVFAGKPDKLTIQNKKYGFSIDLFPGWELNEETFHESSEMYFSIPSDEEQGIYYTFYIVPLKGKYDAIKKDIVKGFRKEIFKSFDEMYGKESLTIKVHKKSSCTKVNKIEVCSAEFNYDYQAEGPQRTYFGIFKTKKGAYLIFFSSNPENYDLMIEDFKENVLGTIKLLK
ncbi:MAG: hypothetical protein A2Y33_06350 [Spirochaetes bacterium GWF1_51_8]|nr:MAG: hypothetical protein A2Y33_06350 [Spirochaetes bacterium GWF1_51_8]